MSEFERWFRETWMLPGEGVTTAVARLHVSSSLSMGSIYKARNGCAVRADTAIAIDAFTGGKVTKEALVFPKKTGRTRLRVVERKKTAS
jgi:hypothetical protein